MHGMDYGTFVHCANVQEVNLIYDLLIDKIKIRCDRID